MFITMTRRPEELLTVPIGTELNYGPSEDSDSVRAKDPLELTVVGKSRDGSLLVRIILEDGQESDELFYFHQPEPPF